MAQQLFYIFVIFATIGMALSQVNVQLVSPVFRVSPYGLCGFSNLRADAPCFNGGGNTDPIYSFFNITTTGQQIKSIVVIPSQTATYYYLGMNNNQIWVVASIGNRFTFVQAAPAPANNWAFGFTDAANTYVAFVSQVAGAATVAKYEITVNGTLTTPPSTINVGASGVNNIQSVVYREPLAWLAGGGSIAEINLDGLNVSSVINVATTFPTVGTITCAAAGTSNTPDILYATNSGLIFFYRSSTGTLDASSATVSGESFSTACGAKGNSYGVFFSSSSARMYQFNFPSGSDGLSPNPAFVVENVGVGKSMTVALTNTDQTGLYLFTYISSGSTPDTVYEFYLGPSSVDFSSVIQPISPAQDTFYRNIFAAYNIGTTIYIATSATNLPRIYQFTIPTTLARNSNVTKSLFYPDYSLPENPTGPNGKSNSIADVGRTLGNGDLLLGNGVASITLPPNSTVSLPPRGPIITYLRGTKSVAPARGGAANTDAPLALRLVSLDEVSGPVVVGNTSQYTLKRSMPFYSSDDAPWNPKQPIRPDGVTVTGTLWELGNTVNLVDASTNYNYLVPPMPLVVNNTVSRPTQAARIASQYSNGYVSFYLREETFIQNTTMIQLNNITYNVTTRTFRYAFTVDSWQFLSSSNFLRLNLIIGVGPDGNGTLGVYNADGNSTTNSPGLLTSYVIVADSAEWTLVLPQNLIQGTEFVDVAAPTVYDPSTNLISIFLPYSVDSSNPSKSANQTYTLLLEYSYIAPPLPSASIQDGGGPKLLPLWIVLGVLGGIVIIGIIVAIIVIFIVYRLVWKNKTEYEIRSTFDKTENALDRNRDF